MGWFANSLPYWDVVCYRGIYCNQINQSNKMKRGLFCTKGQLSLTGSTYNALKLIYCNSNIRNFSVNIGEGKNAEEEKNPTKSRRKVINRSIRPIITKQRKEYSEHEEKRKALGLDWRIMGATILHRYPVILPDIPKWYEDMEMVKDKIEEAKRNHFLGLVGGTNAQFIEESNPTYAEILESMPFKPASRTTEADIKNDRKSLERKLPNSLYLIVKRSRLDNSWQFPQGKIAENETSLRLTSERIVDRAVGKINRWFISNSPAGYNCYAYPEALQKQRKQYGAKIFYYRCQLIDGSVKLETRLYTDYAWVTRDEISEYFDKEAAYLMQHLLPE